MATTTSLTLRAVLIDAIDRVGLARPAQRITGLGGSARALAVAATAHRIRPEPVLYVVASDAALDDAVGDVRFLLQGLEGLADALVSGGYLHEDPVGAPGDFARRGGIVDVFPPDRPEPLRFELAGDEIDEIRTFNPETQRATVKPPSSAGGDIQPRTMTGPISLRADARIPILRATISLTRTRRKGLR